MQVILDSSFVRPGSAPIWGGKKGEFRDWTTWRTVIKANAYAAFARSYAGIDLEDGMISLVKVTEQ